MLAEKFEEPKDVLELKPAFLRKKLFRKSKPHIRSYTSEDLRWLWAAYKNGSFDKLPEMNEVNFAEFVNIALIPRYQQMDMIEDGNVAFRSGRGPVGMAVALYDGWKLEPHVEWFKWATPKNILRGTVYYLQKSRWRADVGVIVIKSLQESKNLFQHVEKYEVIHYRGCIPYGSASGNEYVFSTKGNQRKVK